MTDIYEQIEKKKKKKVPPRKQDGFDDSQNLVPSKQTKEVPKAPEIPQEEDLVHTAKPKSIALEVEVKQELDEFLFSHKEVSWDTFIEAAIVHALQSKNHQKIVNDAAIRLVQRKNSATQRRIQTMTENMNKKKS